MSSTANKVPRYIRVHGCLYELAEKRTATKFTRDNDEAALIDPTKIELSGEQINALARSIMVAFAYAMVMSGVKTSADLRDYEEEALVQQIPRLLQKIATNRSVFAKEMRDLKTRGPERYIKEIGRSLSAL
jgi:hypothetical protein